MTLQNEEFWNLESSANIGRVKREGNNALDMNLVWEEQENAYRIVGKPLGEWTFGRSRKGEDNIKLYLREISCELN